MSYPPRRSTHCLRWEIETPDGADLPIEIAFSYYPGAPARFTPWPGDPAEPDNVDLLSVVALDGRTWRTLTGDEQDAFDAWWEARGEEMCAEHAAEEMAS